ncbi:MULTISPECIES: ABC transporter ATP-binding protein/permease [unclassified Mesorhizobium]|uniref:ABC transporter ATP-binding protein/permease n=1 Tax=unclassified Mesorhizobium TaxID=325217 RepID=UPI0003CF8CC8|nr:MULTISPECIES: ABC transporter ATP-binding protein/permease [unclassified Mesorhizobium]ESX12895.1 ABC transporter ATP-binding protein [Mesorhizobium sp. LSJC255A00]ESX27499.1 ABC transporter ATP-binding protein [Mesorhizobium sp. LSHC440B00]ESX35992.1 ABC transporter ATP-binding protein [Mesorhizobium sp. LSHC432A00]ESX41245.1 ABC transporter ATP-binding protein [Mesorhizobium sp. LSHC440A00]ESX78025.1 ABC transporter ATP-binding protein [Mesorhizobium sp. LSHC414A00]
MRTFWGLMRAYWFSDRWREAWALTVVLALIIALSSKADVWFTVLAGELAASIAFFHDAANTTPLESVLTNAGLLVLLVVFKDMGIIGACKFVSATLHRKWRAWLNARFNAALLDTNHTHYHAQNGSPDAPAPDNIDQRVQESIKDMAGGAIGLAQGVFGVFTSLYFVGGALLANSVEVKGLDALGSYGSAVLALLAVAIYVPVNTWIAIKLGGMLEWLNVRIQKAEGTYRSELITLLRRSFHVSASQGEDVQKTIHGRLYLDIDTTWSKLNIVNTLYAGFESVYNFVGAKVVAYGPGLVPFIHNGVDLKGYITGSEQVNALISKCSWFIHVMPSLATLRANSQRVIELAHAIENVQQPQEFYSQTGRSDFHYASQNPVFGLTIQKLELAHQGEDATPFLSAANLRFRRGEWAFLKGESGCGKTSLIKAINGLWPYGRGTIVFPDGVRSFYAAQEVKLQQVSLKQLVCLPGSEDDYGDAQVAAALHKAGLGDFIEHMADESREGKIWDQLLSGGQKQKLVVARIVLQQPGLLFLDEATGALDPDGKIAFHQAIKDNCPDVTVISIMHEAVAPRSASGEEFYHSVVAIADGVATKRPLVPNLPRELTTILTQPRPVEDKWMRFSRRLKQK